MPAHDQARAINESQMRWLAEVCENLPIERCLDLGLGTGFSSICMAKAGCEIVSVNNEAIETPRRIEALERYRKLCGDTPTVLNGNTDQVLPALVRDHQQFGLIFIDAGHRFDQIFVDVHYSAQLCVPGGILALDDTYYGAIMSVVNWINTNMAHLWEPLEILENTISWRRTSLDRDCESAELLHRCQPGPPNAFVIVDDNTYETMHEPCGDQAEAMGFRYWKSSTDSGKTP